MAQKILVSAKATRGGSGSSGVARYIAQSKIDREREGDRARPLFNGWRDDLTYREANSLVSPDRGGPSKEDIIHLVISTYKDEYDRLGGTEEERLAALHELTRERVKEIAVATNVEELHWFAGIHRNTDNPHGHLAISRDAISRDTQLPTRIEHLPRELLPHKEAGIDGRKEFVQGKIAENFTRSMELVQGHVATRERERVPAHERGSAAPEHDHAGVKKNAPEHEQNREEKVVEKSLDSPVQKGSQQKRRVSGENRDENSRTAQDNQHDISSEAKAKEPEPKNERDKNWKDRYVLGRAMVARGEVERLSSSLSNARNHGDKRRFRVYDESHGRTRRMSEFDIKRRADARAYRHVTEQVILDKTQRHQTRQVYFERDVAAHEHGIHHHQTILQKSIQKMERDLREAQQTYSVLRARSKGIQLDYKLKGQPMPLPLVSRAELSKLQDQAIAAKNFTRLSFLEDIRQSLAIEKNERPRTDREVSRIQGQLLMSETDQQLKEHRLAEFERSRHLTRWEIDGEKWSLADVDKHLGVREKEARLLNNPQRLLPAGLHSPGTEIVRLVKVLAKNSNLLPKGRREAKAEIERLSEIRAQVNLKIADKRAGFHNEIEKAAQLTEALTMINEKEMNSRKEAGLPIPPPTLTTSELHRLEASAQEMKDPALLRKFQRLEQIHWQRRTGNESQTLELSTGRALAREIMAEVSHHESMKKLEEFEIKRKFAPVLIKDAAGQDRVAMLFEHQHERKLSHHVAVRLFESEEKRLLRERVTEAVESQHQMLRDEIDNAREMFEVAQSSALLQRALSDEAGMTHPQPIFTPKEINRLEVYAVKQADPATRLHFEQMIEMAEREGRVFSSELETKDRTMVQVGRDSGLLQDQQHDLSQQQSLTPEFDHLHGGDDLTFMH